MLFYRLKGQERVKKTLSDTVINNKIGHAYIFNGPAGIGRKSFAMEYGKMICCHEADQDNPQPCGRCNSCVLCAEGTNPDIRIITPADGKVNIGVDAVRELEEDISTAPQFGRYKVYIIDSGEKMTIQAQNALLKTLEEPPLYVVIIILCANCSMLLDTVISRSVRIDFARNTDSQIAQIIKENGHGEEVDLPLIYGYADGIPGRALEYISKKREYDVLRNNILEKIEKGQDLAVFLENKNESREFILFTLMSYYRDIAICARYGNVAKINTVPLQNECFRERLYHLGQNIGYHRAIACIEAICETGRLLARNVNAKLAARVLAIELSEDKK